MADGMAINTDEKQHPMDADQLQPLNNRQDQAQIIGTLSPLELLDIIQILDMLDFVFRYQ